MALNVTSVIAEVFDYLQSEIAQPVYKQGVPDIDTLPRDANGKVPYYVAVQFGMPQQKFSGRTFSGVRHDDHILPIYIQVVGPDAGHVEAVALGVVLDKMLGFSPSWSAYVEQRPGGAILPMTQSTGATEAYVFPMSFGLTFQMNPS